MKSILWIGMGILFLQTAQARVERPPQFVAMAFDNCTENSRWEELTRFSDEMNRQEVSIGFTFFVSGVNFIPTADRMSYRGPGQAAGRSNIGFGGSEREVNARIEWMHGLYSRGHELASHAVGHFDGSVWSGSEWLAELQLFRQFFLRAFERAGFTDGDEIYSTMKGFRAPYLEKGSGLYPVLRQLGYDYDTSDDGDPARWPVTREGVWVYPLANLRIEGSGRRTLSMDYNFYATQSGAQDDPVQAPLFKQQMLDTYRAYFRRSYYGNRSPLNIGHHFSNYQLGVYNEALKEFAAEICGQEEVQCVTYSELTTFLGEAGREKISAYERGDFDPYEPITF